MGGDQLASDTTTKCTDGEEEMAMMGGDELFGDGVGGGDFMNEDDTSKTGDDEGNKANNVVESLYPEPHSEFPKIDLNNLGKSTHNMHFVGMNNKQPNRLITIGLFANH